MHSKDATMALQMSLKKIRPSLLSWMVVTSCKIHHLPNFESCEQVHNFITS